VTELRTFGQHVFIISEKEIIKAIPHVKEVKGGVTVFVPATEESSSNKKFSKKHHFIANSKCIIVDITETKLYLAIGKDVPEIVFKHLLGLAMKESKKLELDNCENLGNLRFIDKFISMYNKEFGLYI
jgi:hypothetical protein